MNDEVSQIKERLDIVDVISGYLTLKRAGAYMKANCPFHTEKTPSFMVSPERQSFRCYGCNEGGDIFTFIEKMEGIDFFNALKILADRAGVKLQSRSVRYGNKEYKSDRKTVIFEINDWTKKLFHKILLDHPKAKPARDYLIKRGLNNETITDFEIGYAPDSWDLLVKFLEKKGYKPDEAVQAGAAIRNEKGNIYDRFRGRIIFPINNIMGSTIAFTSRILKDDQDSAKYINSAESPIYVKGKTVYGLDKAKMAIKEADLAVMVEGNMDVIACHQAGFKNVVATSGTAVTLEQLKILARYGGEIAFCFDSDTAGELAIKRAVTLALQNDISVKIISLPPPFKDPDEAIKKDPKFWQKAVLSAHPALEYWIDLLVRKNPGLEVSVKKKIAKEILPVIKTIYSDIEKEYYIRYLATRLSVSEKALIASLEKTRLADQKQGQALQSESGSTKITIAEKLIGLLWHEPKLLDFVGDEFKNYSNDSTQKFVEMVKSEKIIKDKVDQKEKQVLNQFEMTALQDFSGIDKENIESEFKFLISHLRSGQKDAIKIEFAQKIQQAEAEGDKKKLKKLLEEFSSLIK